MFFMAWNIISSFHLLISLLLTNKVIEMPISNNLSTIKICLKKYNIWWFFLYYLFSDYFYTIIFSLIFVGLILLMRDLQTKCGIIVTEDVMSRWWLRYIISSIGSLTARLQIIIYCMVNWKLHHLIDLI